MKAKDYYETLIGTKLDVVREEHELQLKNVSKKLKTVTRRVTQECKDLFSLNGCRILFPNAMITGDYRPDRINIDVSDEGVIEKVWLG